VAIIGTVYGLHARLAEPVVGLAVGVIVGGVLQVVLQVPWLLEKGVSLRPRWMPGHPALARIGRLMMPAVFGSAVYQLNQFIGTLLASFLPQGSVSWLYYADRIVQFPLGVFAIAVSTAALPSLSRQAAEEGLQAFRHTLGYTLRLVFFISLPSMAGLMVLAPLIVRVLFERGVFEAGSTEMTAQALVFYAAGLWAFSGIRVLVAGFYGLQDTRTPVKAAVLALLVHVGCSLALMGPLRHGGLALALSIASAAQLMFLGVVLRGRIHGLEGRRLLRSVGVSLVSAGAMSALIFWVYRVWWCPGAGTGLGELVAGLGGLVALGAGVYFALCRFLGSEEMGSVLALVRRKP
jgi:putative peptidoglycan lipid II flippase